MFTLPPEAMREHIQQLRSQTAATSIVRSCNPIVDSNATAVYSGLSLSMLPANGNRFIASSPPIWNPNSSEFGLLSSFTPSGATGSKNPQSTSDRLDIFFESSTLYDIPPVNSGHKKPKNTIIKALPIASTVSRTRGRINALMEYYRAFNFLDRVYTVSSTDIEDATDEIFQFVDGRLSVGDFAVCRQVLKMADISRLPTTLMRSFLTITFAAKTHLPERVAFYDRVFSEIIRQRGVAIAHRLLDTLK